MSFSAQLIYLVSWILGLPLKNIVPSTDLRTDLNLDGYDFDLLIFRLEGYFHCECTSEEIDRIETVKDLIELFHAKSGLYQTNSGMQPAAQ
jgi:acyl carrier protein